MIFLSFLTLIALSYSLYLHYRIERIKKERDNALKKQKADANVLFLQSRYASMGETLANIAHQWKQPLNAIGSIQNSIKASLVFTGEVSREKLLTGIETSFQLLQHLGETIDTFYGFLARYHQANENFFLSEVFETIRKITGYSLDNSNIKLTLDLETNPAISGNANEFTHAMLNLILNAKDALDENGVTDPRIHVHVSGDAEYCTIEVSDNAGGIRFDPVDLVFAFHITSKDDGSGLGLFMTKKIIETRFGGTIRVNNRDGGACFSVTFPYTHAQRGGDFLLTAEEKSNITHINELANRVIKLEEVEKILTRWMSIFEHARWGIAMHVGMNKTFETTNSAFNTLYGYTPKELQNINVLDLYPPESLPILEEVHKEAMEKGYAIFETLNRRKDGSIFPVSVELIIIKNEEGAVLYHIANIWDLTEKKASVERLLLKKFALDHIQDSVFMVDKNARFHYVNDGACTALGYTREEILELNVGDIDPDWPRERWGEHWEALKKAGSITMELRHRRKDGTVFSVEVSANYIEYGGHYYNMAIARDITERLRLEEQKDNERMKFFFERQLVGMAITSPEKGWLHVNDKLCRMLEYAPEEFYSMTWAQITYPEDLAPDVEQFERLLNNEIDDYTLEKRFIRKGGTLVYTNLAVSCVRRDNHSIEYVLALIEDITERKFMETSLQEANDRYLQILDNSSDVIYLLDVTPEGKYVYVDVNAAYEKVTGIPRDVVIGLCVDDIEDEIFRTILLDKFDSCFNAGCDSEYTADYPFPGGVRTFHSLLSAIHDESGRIVRIVGSARDITEHNEMQEYIRQSETNLKIAQKIAKVGSWHVVIETNLLTWSDETYRIFELEKESVSDLHKTFYEYVHPDDREAVSAPYLETLQSKLPYEMEHRLLMPDGRIKYVVERCEHTYAPDGTPLYSDGTVHDITERKLMEKELEESHAFLVKLIDAIPDPIFVKNRAHTWMLLNQAFCNLSGLKKETLLGKSDYDVFPREEADIFWEKDEIVFDNGDININEEAFTSTNGITHHIQTVKATFQSMDGTAYLVGTIRDLSERKAMEDALRQSLEFNEGIIGAIPDLLFEIAPDGTYVGVWAQDEAILVAQRAYLLGKNFKEILPPDVVITSLQTMKEVDERGFSVGNSYSLDLPEGKRWFELSVSKKKMSGNYITLARDITERKNAEERLESNRNLLHTILESSPGVVTFALDREYRYLAFDSQHAQVMRTIFGNEISIGMDMLEAITSIEDAKIAKRSFDRALLGESFVAEEEYGDERLSRQYWQVFYSPIRTEAGEIIGLTCFNMDISERKKAENAIKELNETLEERVIKRTSQLKMIETAINSSSEAIYVNDDSLAILYVNDAACSMLGYTKDEFLRMNITDIDTHLSPETIEYINERKLIDGKAVFRTKHRTKEGSLIDVEIIGNFFLHDDIAGFVSVVKEI